MADRPTLYLVDGSSYLYRAYHAMPALTNSAGEPTGAILGVANMLRRMLNEDQPALVAVVFDAKGKTFRHERYPEYKANRPPMPKELGDQVEAIHEFVEAMGLPLLQVEGVEADDVIGTLAERATEAGMDVVVSTSDKDLAQLVDPHTTLVNTMTDTHMDRAGVEEKFGVPPERIIDLLALTGDTSDNIPGVHKCGPKTAQKWLSEWGDLEGVMAHADDIGGKLGEYLREALETLPLSRELVTIRTDLDLDTQPAELERREADEAKLRELLRRYEFNSWLKELDPGEDEPAAETADFDVVMDRAALEAWVKKAEQAELLAVDTETTSLDPMRARLVGISLATKPGKACYIPVGHDDPDAPDQLPMDEVLNALRPVLEDPERPKVGQHIKYDMTVFERHGIHLQGIAYDTMLESYVLNSTGSRHDMDSLALKYLGRQTIKYEDVAGKGAKQISFNEVRVEDAAPYAAEDADITLRLHHELWPRLQDIPSLQSVFTDIEVPLIPVLERMERRGVLIDGELLKKHSAELAKKVRELEEQAHKEAGQPFNLGSPKQLQEILFEGLELPVIRKTPTGQPSTAEDVLQELAADYALPKLILEYRSLSKLKSTYTDKLPEQIDPDTGRVHTSYHQAVAATGRLSSSDPNLQNIPVRTEEGRRIRQAFVAPEGRCILACDYSQIELRIMAHLSGDEGLLEAFAAGEDIHRATAAEVFETEPDEVTPNQRRAAKAINFGLMYGMSAFGLARNLDIERGEAQKYMDRYFERYPGVHEFMEKTRKQARKDGYVETMFGRRLYLTEINASNVNRRQAAERAAINAPMQGTAADIIKRAMITVDGWLEESKLDACLVMQVHDELVFEVANGQLDELRAGVVEHMSGAAELDVPLDVDAGDGPNWEAAH